MKLFFGNSCPSRRINYINIKTDLMHNFEMGHPQAIPRFHDSRCDLLCLGHWILMFLRSQNYIGHFFHVILLYYIFFSQTPPQPFQGPSAFDSSRDGCLIKLKKDPEHLALSPSPLGIGRGNKLQVTEPSE
ncbi:hypothetical protein AA313_de0207665 [Arthrobotrys entomopaga]|nr:hypothetical protein AA313_de0207665 [Arthrobotrys entomopaga]